MACSLWGAWVAVLSNVLVTFRGALFMGSWTAQTPMLGLMRSPIIAIARLVFNIIVTNIDQLVCGNCQ